MNNILLIEDDQILSESLCRGLEAEGFSVSSRSTGMEGVLAVEKSYGLDLVILDLGLPDQDGFEILREVHSARPELPVLILSAREEIEDKVRGLETGAVDYLTKPFAFSELLARIRLRLRTRSMVKTTLQCGGVVVELLTRTVRIEGKREEMPPREYDLLCSLLRAEGGVVSREEIGRDVWKSPKRMSSLDNLIDVHIKRLRERFPSGKGVQIRTLRGVGYVLEETV